MFAGFFVSLRPSPRSPHWDRRSGRSFASVEQKQGRRGELERSRMTARRIWEIAPFLLFDMDKYCTCSGELWLCWKVYKGKEQKNWRWVLIGWIYLCLEVINWLKKEAVERASTVWLCQYMIWGWKLFCFVCFYSRVLFWCGGVLKERYNIRICGTESLQKPLFLYEKKFEWAFILSFDLLEESAGNVRLREKRERNQNHDLHVSK